MLTWTNRHGRDIGNGPLWDAMPTSQNASITSTVAGATEEDDEKVSVAEEDQEDPTTQNSMLSITLQEWMMYTTMTCTNNGTRLFRM